MSIIWFKAEKNWSQKPHLADASDLKECRRREAGGWAIDSLCLDIKMCP